MKCRECGREAELLFGCDDKKSLMFDLSTAFFKCMECGHEQDPSTKAEKAVVEEALANRVHCQQCGAQHPLKVINRVGCPSCRN